MKNLITFLVFGLLIVASSTRCARRGSPNGGPKDSLSPIMVEAFPEYKTTHFNAKKIKLNFDEYIKFKDLNKQLIISPPLKNKPIIKPIGGASKKITIEISDTLKENTTYSFNFGNSIVDNNEGNKLGSFKYVFSTGDYVDSLEVNGSVVNAYENEELKNISVLLYEINDSYTDSIIYKEKPTYVTNTLDTLNFNLTNLKAGTYQLIALEDYSNNYIYNPVQDRIGYLKDPIQIPTDSSYTIKLFKENLAFSTKRPLESKVGKILFGYLGKKEPVDIKLLTKTPSYFKSLISKEKGKDTLNYWYTPFETDSLHFQVTSKNIDTTFTVFLRTSKVDSLNVTSAFNNVLHPKDTFSIETNIPIDIDSLDISKISIINQDTLRVPFESSISSSKTKMYLNFERKRNEKFLISFFPKAFVDFQGETNDTIIYQLATKDKEDYGSIEIALKNVKEFPIIVDLITKKGELVERQFSEEKTTFTFIDIVPASYLIRVIKDTNGNKKWDTGNFLNKTQPEKVYYYLTELKLRANWEINETYDLEAKQFRIKKDTVPKKRRILR